MEAEASRSYEETYYVVSNPYPLAENGSLRVLFTGNSQTKPGHKPGPKVVDYYLLHHVLSGTGTYSCLGQTYVLGPGDSFLIEPGALIQYTADLERPWHYQWIAFQGTEAAAILQGLGLDSRRPVVHTERNRRIAGLFKQIEQSFQSRSPGANLTANGCLQLVFASFAEALQPADHRLPQTATNAERIVQQAVQYLSAQYAEPITIQLMADTLGYNRAYLSTLFKEQTGVSPVTFLLSLRLDKARHLLRERPELTVEQIASSVGFPDPLHFSKQFKRCYAVSPNGYRSSLR